MWTQRSTNPERDIPYTAGVKGRLKDLFNANACWLVLIYDTLIIPYVAKRISKYVSYIL